MEVVILNQGEETAFEEELTQVECPTLYSLSCNTNNSLRCDAIGEGGYPRNRRPQNRVHRYPACVNSYQRLSGVSWTCRDLGDDLMLAWCWCSWLPRGWWWSRQLLGQQFTEAPASAADNGPSRLHRHAFSRQSARNCRPSAYRLGATHPSRLLSGTPAENHC